MGMRRDAGHREESEDPLRIRGARAGATKQSPLSQESGS